MHILLHALSLFCVTAQNINYQCSKLGYRRKIHSTLRHSHRDVASGGGQWCPAPHLKSVNPHFMFCPLVAAYIQYSIFKMWPPFWFLAPLLLYPGNGPAQPGSAFSKHGARLEALLRGPIQWRVQKFLRRASSHNCRNHE